MELLKKITLYDLLGYTLPGSVLIALWMWNRTVEQVMELEDIKPGSLILFLVGGFLVGNLISELMSRILKRCKQKQKLGCRCTELGISVSTIAKQLRKCNIIESESVIHNIEDVDKYSIQIYAMVQINPQNDRIHNYASAELLYKNMIAVVAFTGIMGIINGIYGEILIGIIGGILFFLRWKRFFKKKLDYMLCWFVYSL